MTEFIFVGIVVSLLYTEVTGLSPGGIIVPAYFAMFLFEPVRLIATLVLALLCFGAVRLLSSVMILYGRRKFAMYMLVGMAFKALFGLIYSMDAGVFDPVGLIGLSIGYLIPGLLGKDMERQGIVPTVLSLGVVVCLVRLVCLVVPL